MKNEVVDYVVKWWADRLDGTIKDRPLEETFGDLVKEQILFDKDIPNEDKKDFYDYFFNITEEMIKHYQKHISKSTRIKFEKYLRHFITSELYNRGHAYLSTDVTSKASAGFGFVCYSCGIDTEKVLNLPRGVEMFITKDSAEIRFDEDGPYMPLFNAEKKQVKPILLPSKFNREM